MWPFVYKGLANMDVYHLDLQRIRVGVLIQYATLASKAKELMPHRYECLRRTL
jgi:hypothetical protein